MKAQKDPKTGKWFVQYRYSDWTGQRRKSTKRGFLTKREAEEWLRQYLLKQESDPDMNFETFVDLYFKDMEARLRKTTIRNKRYIVDLKVLPYFRKRKLSEIRPADIRTWQNILLREDYSETYLRSINNQVSAIFNYAVRYYGLKQNPCRIAGSIGKSRAKEMNFWTQEEFNKFIEVEIMKNQMNYCMFMTLYWTGMRLGELLALTKEDIDLDAKTIRINKSLQRLNRTDVITDPKTPKSRRVISISDFLAEDLKDYIDSIYGLEDGDRIFPVTKYHLERAMWQGIKESGVKKIRIHDLRHSHASLLVEMGFSPLEIAERLGHERVETTLNTYSHLYPDKQKHLASKLDQRFREEL